METEVLDTGEAGLRRAALLLRSGRLVAFPTETVYGLGARRGDEEAVERLRRVKHRAAGKPFAALISSPEDASRHGQPGGAGARLAERFWPGPLTLVLPGASGEQVGLRCPDCDVTRRLIRMVGCPVVASSANLSGRPPALCAEEVLRAFDGQIAAVLDGGRASLGRASTVVRVLGEEVEILREGAVSEADIRAALAGTER